MFNPNDSNLLPLNVILCQHSNQINNPIVLPLALVVHFQGFRITHLGYFLRFFRGSVCMGALFNNQWKGGGNQRFINVKVPKDGVALTAPH